MHHERGGECKSVSDVQPLGNNLPNHIEKAPAVFIIHDNYLGRHEMVSVITERPKEMHSTVLWLAASEFIDGQKLQDYLLLFYFQLTLLLRKVFARTLQCCGYTCSFSGTSALTRTYGPLTLVHRLCWARWRDGWKRTTTCKRWNCVHKSCRGHTQQRQSVRLLQPCFGSGT